VSLFLRDEEDPKRFAVEDPTTDTLVVDEPPSQEVDAAAKPQKAAKKPAKKASLFVVQSACKKLPTQVLPSRPIIPRAPPTTCVIIPFTFTSL
jgi:hypothetical protein